MRRAALAAARSARLPELWPLVVVDLGIPDVLMAPRAGVPGPAVKPGAIVRTLIEQSTTAGELVLDPFCGGGSIPLEALRVGAAGGLFPAGSAARKEILTALREV